MMKKLLTVLSIIALAALNMQAQNKWKVDPVHSSLKFSIPHMTISEVEGAFKNYNVELTHENEDFSDAKINFSADINSISTENEKRDGHLKSDDFFNAAKFPKMTFTSTSFKKVSDSKYELEGDLTIRDITKRAKLDVTHGGVLRDKDGKATKAGFKVSGAIDRFDYGLKFNALTEAGGLVVGKDVSITAKLELVPNK